MGCRRLRVRVLRLEVRQHLGRFLLAQPLIRIVESVAVMGAEMRAAGGVGCIGHHATLSQVELTDAREGARIYRGRLTEEKPTVNSSFVTPITSASPFLHTNPKAIGGNRNLHRRAGHPAGTLLRLHQRLS